MVNLTRRRITTGLAAAVAAGLFPSVPLAEAGSEPRIIKHQMGSTEIAGSPIRIIALEFSFVQALDALGVIPVGIADDNQARRIEQLLARTIEYNSVGTRLEPNLELVSALNPDLIIADEVRHSSIYSQLGSIAPTIVLNSWEGGYQTIKDGFLTVASALGDRPKGEKVLARHEAAMAELITRIPKGEKRSFLLAVATSDSMSLHTSSSFTGSVFEAMGLRHAIKSPLAVESGAGLERMIAVNPDVLLVATDDGNTVFDQWKDSSAFANISAVKTKKVFQVNRNQFARFRGLQTAEMIAREILAKVYS
jgi:ferric citrate transport system substrate-binding protein